MSSENRPFASEGQAAFNDNNAGKDAQEEHFEYNQENEQQLPPSHTSGDNEPFDDGTEEAFFHDDESRHTSPPPVSGGTPATSAIQSDGHQTPRQVQSSHGEEEEEEEEEEETEDDGSEEEIIVDEANSRLYELLQVDPSVPAHQIYSTFKHLTLRDQYKMAFNILSDAHTKRVYDIGGESAVDHLESKAYGPFVTVAGSTLSMLVYGLFWLVLTFFLTLFFIFMMLHVDKWEGGGSWSWSEVLVPLYILTVLGVAGSLALVLTAIVAPRNKDDGIVAYRSPIVKLIVTAGYLAFLILADIAISSDDPYGKPWMGYFVILIVVDVISICDWMLSKHPAKIRKMLEPTSEKPLTEKEAVVGRRLPNKQPKDLVFGFMFLGAFDIVVAVLRGVFLGLKIEGTLDWKWYVVVIPIALRLVSSALFRLHQSRIQHFIGQRSTCSVVMGFIGTCIMNALMITSTFLICYFIHDPAHTTMVEALIPIYFVLAFLTVASIFTAVYVLIANYRVISLEKEEARGIRAAQKAFGASPSSQDGGDTEDDGDENRDAISMRNMYNADNDPFNNNNIHHGEPVSSMGTESVVSAETIVEEVDEDDEEDIRPYVSPISHPSPISHHPSDQSANTQ